MAKPSKEKEAELVGKDELVHAILGVLDRTYAAQEEPGTFHRLEEFFRALDEPTLRAIAYRHGVFEPELETDQEEREQRPAPGQDVL